MHLKAYAIDGSTVRTGSANFSPSGECEQDNELSISRDRADAARFESIFEIVWRNAEELIDFPPAEKATEPD